MKSTTTYVPTATPSLELKAAIDESAVSAVVVRRAPCAKVIHTTVDRTVVTERFGRNDQGEKTDSSSSALVAALSWAAMGAGIGVAVAGDSDDGVHVPAGITTAVLGSIFGVWFTVDAVSFVDDEEHIGHVTLTPKRVDADCSRMATDLPVILVWPNGKTSRETTNDAGVATFALPSDDVLLAWRRYPTLKVIAEDQSATVSFHTLNRFKRAAERRDLAVRRFLEAQAAAEKSLQSITKGDSIWITLGGATTRDFSRFAVSPKSSDHIYALDAQGRLVRSTDAGQSWSVILEPSFQGQRIQRVSVDAADASILLVSAESGQTFWSRDGGDSWIRLEALPTGDGTASGSGGADAGLIRAVLVARDLPGDGAPADPDANLLLVAMEDGLYASGSRSGGAWTRLEGLPGGGVRSVASTPAMAGMLVVVMDGGDVFTTEDAGKTWRKLDVVSATLPQKVHVHPADSNLLYVVTEGSQILRSQDRGASFTQVAEGVPAGVLIAQLSFDPNNPMIVYAATSAGILYSTDMGGAFKPLNAGLGGAGVLSVTGLQVAGQDLFALAANAGMMRLGTVRDKQTLTSVNFETDSAALKKNARRQLDAVAARLGKDPSLVVRVDGHTDSRGSAEHNAQLSLRRAQSVCEYLQTKGIAETRMVPQGLGPKFPVSDNETDKGRQANRRVDIYLVGGRDS